MKLVNVVIVNRELFDLTIYGELGLINKYYIYAHVISVCAVSYAHLLVHIYT